MVSSKAMTMYKSRTVKHFHYTMVTRTVRRFHYTMLSGDDRTAIAILTAQCLQRSLGCSKKMLVQAPSTGKHFHNTMMSVQDKTRFATSMARYFQRALEASQD